MQYLIELELEHLNSAGLMLSEAFYQDPMCRYLYPDDRRRRNAVLHTFKFMIRLGLKYGHGISIDNDIMGLLVWFESPADCSNILKQFRCGAVRLLFQLGPKQLLNTLHYDQVSQILKKKHTTDKDYLLYILAINPQYQGQGFASLLMRKFLASIDRSRRVYLETSNPLNIPIYEHFGFRKLEEIAFYGRKAFIWPMIKA